jgi:tetratricopeptide (TPR) repeat protein
VAAIQQAQTRLRSVPDDETAWAGLGSAYVQQARITADPAYYPKAEGALRRSLALDPTGNWAGLVGMGALLNARHDFRRALDQARRAEALNPWNGTVYGVEDDALTQLGDYAGADAALERMLRLQPGVAAFTRASYHFEERGRVDDARTALLKALAQAIDPVDAAFCRYYLGELAFNTGDPAAAMSQYRAGLVADPEYDPLLAGRAKAEAALGRTDEALRDYAAAIDRVPQPQYVLEYAELLLSLGRRDDAQQQFSLLDSEQRLMAANGVTDDLMAAVVAADHGSPADAVRHARAEWGRRHSVLVADALAWALHRAGRDEEALRYAEQAGRLGWRNATFSYHAGMIELALGQRQNARRDLHRALSINPRFSVQQAPIARKALAGL